MHFGPRKREAFEEVILPPKLSPLAAGEAMHRRVGEIMTGRPSSMRVVSSMSDALRAPPVPRESTRPGPYSLAGVTTRRMQQPVQPEQCAPESIPRAQDDNPVLDVLEAVAVVELVTDLFGGDSSGSDSGGSSTDDYSGGGGGFGGGGASGDW